ncbi:hypothetical protein RI054_24g102110 [Pseudoscourfieldia marina]
MRDRAEHERKMKGGKRKRAGGKSHTKAEDLASCRFGKPPPPSVGKSRSNIPPHAPTHALEEDADAEAVVREAADEDTAADTPDIADTATKKLTHLCRGALKGKHTTSPNIVNRERTDRVGGALVHTDIKTDVPTPSYRGDKYFIHFTDDKTRHTAVRIAEEERFRKRTSGRRIHARRASKSKNCAPAEKVLNEGEMKKTLANNIHTTTPP